MLRIDAKINADYQLTVAERVRPSPLRLKGQLGFCRSFGFELSCTGSTNQTILQLPSSEKLLVEEIDYRTREILVHYKDSCLSRQLNFSLAASPFKLRDRNLEEDSTFFSCSLDKSKSDQEVVGYV